MTFSYSGRKLYLVGKADCCITCSVFLQTPLDMLATVGIKNSRLASAKLNAISESTTPSKDTTRMTMRDSDAYASRAHLAKTTTQADYFAANHPYSTLDWEPNNDPVGLSLVTEGEARQIIDFYFAHCNPLVGPTFLAGPEACLEELTRAYC